MKEIVFVGSDKEGSSILKLLHNSSKYKVKKAKNLKKAAQIIDSHNPDFVLCAGTIQVDKNGKYVLEID